MQPAAYFSSHFARLESRGFWSASRITETSPLSELRSARSAALAPQKLRWVAEVVGRSLGKTGDAKGLAFRKHQGPADLCRSPRPLLPEPQGPVANCDGRRRKRRKRRKKAKDPRGSHEEDNLVLGASALLRCYASQARHNMPGKLRHPQRWFNKFRPLVLSFGNATMVPSDHGFNESCRGHAQECVGRYTPQSLKPRLGLQPRVLVLLQRD